MDETWSLDLHRWHQPFLPNNPHSLQTWAEKTSDEYMRRSKTMVVDDDEMWNVIWNEDEIWLRDWDESMIYNFYRKIIHFIK